MAEGDQQPQPGVGVPLSIWTHHFDQLHMELRANNVIAQMP